jgi:hypothetical protein
VKEIRDRENELASNSLQDAYDKSKKFEIEPLTEQQKAKLKKYKLTKSDFLGFDDDSKPK